MLFHHQKDTAEDFSYMERASSLLVQKGFKDEVAYTLNNGRRKIANHFWQYEYNEPLINFYKNMLT